MDGYVKRKTLVAPRGDYRNEDEVGRARNGEELGQALYERERNDLQRFHQRVVRE